MRLCNSRISEEHLVCYQTFVHERASINCNAEQAPLARPLFKRGQTSGKNRATKSAAPHLILLPFIPSFRWHPKSKKNSPPA